MAFLKVYEEKRMAKESVTLIREMLPILSRWKTQRSKYVYHWKQHRDTRGTDTLKFIYEMSQSPEWRKCWERVQILS